MSLPYRNTLLGSHGPMTAILSGRVQAVIMYFYMVGGDGNAPRGNFRSYYADGFTDR